ncbi:AsmA family protein [Hellea balneolensis]|uniref:AsmA family protein n=1 Tax=Hellea balneolensis TaxID=287478 RepID=UPI0003FFDB82|nr:AsmA family protein [Hellea balneolensis]
MKKLLIGTGILGVILVGGLIALPSLIPSSVYKENIETQLSRELARDVRVQGDVKLSVFPLIKANTGRVEIVNPDGFKADNFAEMDAMSARIKLFPLFSKRVEIASFSLKNPAINLEKLANGESNWTFGEPEETAPEPVDSGPFKRDGRYSEVDPNIGAFSLENGTVTYSDAVSGTDLAIKDVNVDFSLPSLTQTVEIDGSMIYDDTPVEVKLSLDSIRAFLDGKEAPVSLALETEFADISAKGRFLAGQDIVFNVDLDGDVSDMAKLTALSPKEVPYADIVSRAKLSGNYGYDGAVLTAKGADISAEGKRFNAAFKGDATLAETPIFDGRVELDSQDVAALAQKLGQDVKGLSLLSAVNLTADLAGQDTGFTASNINADISGDGLSGTFKGSAIYGEALSAKGDFTADITSIPQIITALEMDLPQAKAVQDLKASGTVDMQGDTIRLSGVSAKTDGGIVSGQYKGGATLGDVPAYDGEFDVTIASLSEFASVTATEVPYADAIGKIAIAGQVSGQGEAIMLPRLNAALSGGQINGRYDGTATWNSGASLDGTLNIDIPSLRQVATTAGTELPPSTKSGDIFGPFSVDGTVKGTPDNIQFTNAKIALDDIKGKGTFSVNLKPATPFVTGKMDLDGLDLSPYMAAYSAQNPTGEIQPWSTAPINTAPLRSVDGDFNFSTPNIKTDRITMGQSDISAKLRGGVMTANMPNIALYGGLGRMIATLDGSGPEAKVSLDIGLNDVNSNSFLASVAGFTQAEGELGSSFKISGRGASQADIMKSLNGAGDFKLLNGVIKGVDLPALLTGLDQALTSRSIPSGIGPSQITKFQDLAGLVKIENGVASINSFTLQGLGVLADGSGQIDLGNQTIDFGLRPRLTGESASNLGAFGIPIEIKGGFGSAKVGLDTDMLGRIAADRARAEASSLIQEQVGGTARDLLGGLINGGTQGSSGTPNTSGASDPKKTEEVVGDLLGGLLGGSKTDANTSSETTPADVEAEKTAPKEPSVEDALLGIFGKKKKKEPAE